MKTIVKFFLILRSFWDRFVLQPLYKCSLGYCGKNVTMRNLNRFPSKSVRRMYLYDNVVMKSFSLISVTGKFIMKENAGASMGLIVITGNHQRKSGQLFISEAKSHELDIEEDVVVEEDVWLGANVTLLAGITIGRGATIGAGSVCFKSIPPYSIAVGNPAKVVGFNFTPEEIVAHEEKLYPEEARIPKETLEKNYEKYFIDRIKDIKNYTRI